MKLVDLLYPRRCPICLDVLPLRGEDICAPCRKKVRLVQPPLCYKCGKPLKDDTKEYCASCIKRVPSFTQGISWAEYSSKYMRRMMAEVKYHQNCQILDFPCADFAARYEDEVRVWSPEVLIPVPVHPSRLRKRGYNQAAEIGKRLAKAWHLSMDTQYLARLEKTTAQKELSSEDRRRNLLEAFHVVGEWNRYQKVLLVDDIYTTGATVSACARALKEAGVEQVYVATLCTSRDYS